MSNTPSSTPHDLTLPEGYGVVELSNGRFCPVWVDDHLTFPHITVLCWEGQTIPFARGPQETHGLISFASRSEAVQYCERKAEEWNVLYGCDQLAAGSELYPERNAWYEEAIAHRCQFVQPRWSPLGPRLEQWCDAFIASVWIVLNREGHLIQVSAATKDEACATLWDRLVERLGPAPDEEHFPERNAQYQEEIAAVTGGVVTIFSEDGQTVADVRLQDGTFLQAREATIELALQRLCEQAWASIGGNRVSPLHNENECPSLLV